MRRLLFPIRLLPCVFLCACASGPRHADTGSASVAENIPAPRERILLDHGWRFHRHADGETADTLVYDVRPPVTDARDDRPPDAMPTAAARTGAAGDVLKPWILPCANDFIPSPARHHARPPGHPGSDFPFVRADFDDLAWERVAIPHDWAARSPFDPRPDALIGGSMGRLPVNGVAWYRLKLDLPASDAGRRLFLEVDGAMSHAVVWLNGRLVGGWPFGYSSWRLDLTPHARPGEINQLAIRLDNPAHSSRWYPGSGLYRHVWLTKTDPIHVGQWGSRITTREVSASSATVDLELEIANTSGVPASVEAVTEVFAIEPDGRVASRPLARLAPQTIRIHAGQKSSARGTVTVVNPRLWGPPPTQTPALHLARTTLRQDGRVVDRHETRFGIRSLVFDPGRGLLVNGERIPVRGANQHHDLGALGAAFNVRAAERQLELLRDMGCNAIRMAHNPPAPELLDLTDRLGFLVIDEIFDIWERKKTPHDSHLLFPDWHEADLRAMIRRDRNHPSVILWSVGNEVGEQYTGEEGAAVARRLRDIARSEDDTRPVTAAMNYAKPGMPLPAVLDVISLNYQGEGIRTGPAYAGLPGITTPPLYDEFRRRFPDKMILGSETAAAVSSRGAYLFPVHPGDSAPVKDGQGGDPVTRQVSAYELYTAPFGSSADRVFASLEAHPFVAGAFVWSGWDYLGEPLPYYSSRSSYFGVIDLAGFPKDRFYLYQSEWRPELPMAHILPHWTWPERVGQITPVHVFTSGDEAELFLNGRPLGRKKKGPGEYRLRWDDAVYEPGRLEVVAYKHGREWARDRVLTAGAPAALRLAPDRPSIAADGRDLCFLALRVTDANGVLSPRSAAPIAFSVEGPGEIVATDNGDATDMTAFPSHERRAFQGLALVIVRARPGARGDLVITAASPGLAPATTRVRLASP